MFYLKFRWKGINRKLKYLYPPSFVVDFTRGTVLTKAEFWKNLKKVKIFWNKKISV